MERGNRRIIFRRIYFTKKWLWASSYSMDNDESKRYALIDDDDDDDDDVSRPPPLLPFIFPLLLILVVLQADHFLATKSRVWLHT